MILQIESVKYLRMYVHNSDLNTIYSQAQGQVVLFQVHSAVQEEEMTKEQI
jgi:hypothetical protein